MNRDPKKFVAATIGVIEYLKAERERTRQESVAAPEAPPPPGDRQIVPSGSLWAASGRMEIMRFRNLMELRVFRKGRQG
jgi:hypothetical protein